jgi:hypothetical protein
MNTNNKSLTDEILGYKNSKDNLKDIENWIKSWDN